MSSFNKDLIHTELDYMEGVVDKLRTEIAQRSDGVTVLANDLSRQLYEAGLRLLVQCTNHAIEMVVDEAEALVAGASAVNLQPEQSLDQDVPRHGGP